MSEPYKTSEIRATVTVSSILPNGDSSIRVEYPTTGASGQKRSFFRQIPVPDPSLFSRVQAELREGDKIEMTAINEWYEDGYATRLLDFRKATDFAHKDNATHETNGVAHDTTTETARPLARESRMTVKY